jgi:hypothetical protein
VPGEPDSARHSSGHRCMLAAMTHMVPSYFKIKHLLTSTTNAPGGAFSCPCLPSHCDLYPGLRSSSQQKHRLRGTVATVTHCLMR